MKTKILRDFPTPDPKLEGVQVCSPIRFIAYARETDKTNDLSKGFYEIRMDIMLAPEPQWLCERRQISAHWLQDDGPVEADQFARGLRALADAIEAETNIKAGSGEL